MFGNFLYICFIVIILVFWAFLVRRGLIQLFVIFMTKKQLVWWRIRDWVYYEDEFGSGDEKTMIHMRICQYTDETQIYDYDKKRFVDYVN